MNEKHQIELSSHDVVVFNGWQRNLPSSPKGNVPHQHPYSPVEATEDSNGVNTDEKSSINRDEWSEQILASLVPIKSNVPLALRRLG